MRSKQMHTSDLDQPSRMKMPVARITSSKPPHRPSPSLATIPSEAPRILRLRRPALNTRVVTLLFCASSPLLVLPRPIVAAAQFRDAEVYTDSGYDTENGRGAICWVAPRHATDPPSAAEANAFNVVEGRAAHAEREHARVETAAGGGRDRLWRVRRRADVDVDVLGQSMAKLTVNRESRPSTPTADVFNKTIEGDDRSDKGQSPDGQGLGPQKSHQVSVGDLEDAVVWPSPLVPAFPAGHTHMLSACPRGVDVHLDAPPEIVMGETMRVGVQYAYRIRGEIRLDLLRSELGLSERAFVYSSEGGPAVAVQVKKCPMEGKFCSPFLFIHKQKGNGLSGGHKDMHGYDGEDKAENVAGEEEGNRHAFRDYRQEDPRADEYRPGGETEILSFSDQNKRVLRFDIIKQVVVKEAGIYMPLAELQFFLADKPEGSRLDDSYTDSDVLYKFDVANALHEHVITIHDPPVINIVSLGAEIFTYVVIGIAGLLQLLLMAFLVEHRKHSVVKLSQGYFLLLFLASALVATFSCFLFNPKNDVYCQLLGPLVMIPLQFMLAIVIGRLRRVIVLMRPLMLWQQEQYTLHGRGKMQMKLKRMLPPWVMGSISSEASVSDFSPSNSSSILDTGYQSGDGSVGIRTSQYQSRRSPGKFCCGRCNRSSSAKRLRAQFTVARLWANSALITLPQIAVQIIGLAAFPQEQTIAFNEGESVGRPQCTNDRFPSYHFVQYALLGATLLYLVYTSQKSKALPSLFNEAESVASGVLATVLIVAVGAAVMAASSESTSSPNVRYILQVAIVLCLTVNLSFRLVCPKLRLVWSGEQIVVSKLVQEHRKKTRGGDNGWMGGGVSKYRLTAAATPMAHAGAWISTRIKSDWKLNIEAKANDTGDSNLDESSGKDGTRVKKEGGRSSVDLVNSPPNKVAFGAVHVGEEKSPEVTAALRLEHQSEMNNNDIESIGESSENLESSRTKFAWVKNDMATDDQGEIYLSRQRHSKRKSELIISETLQAPKTVTVRIIKLAELVGRVNRRIMCGMHIPAEEWEELQKSLHDMNKLFTDQIKFSWKGEENRA